MTNTKLWVDDSRRPPDETWDWAKTSAEALEMLDAALYETVSLDHQLGQLPTAELVAKIKAIEARGDEPEDVDFIDTTRPIVLRWITDGNWPATILVHSTDWRAVWLTTKIAAHKP